MAQRDYYDVLQVPRDADAATVKKAHRKLARQLHPDVNKNDPRAAEKFQEVQEAYDVLSDSEKRRRYDQFGRYGGDAGVGSRGEGSGPFGPFDAGGGPFAGRTITPEDLEELRNGGFRDAFDGLFGAEGPFGRRSRARPGPGDYASSARSRPRPVELGIEVPVMIPFLDAAAGTTVSITVPGQPERVEAKIPPGVKDGQRVRLRGRGRRAGGAVGDLILIVSVTPHPYFRRDGLNIILDVPVSVWDALLGTKIDVPTLRGTVTISVPPGSSSGRKLRITGRGITRGTEVGDQLIVLRLIAPPALSQEQRALVEQLRAAAPVDTAAERAWNRL